MNNKGIRRFLLEVWLKYRTKAAKQNKNLLDFQSELAFIKGQFSFVPAIRNLESDYNMIYSQDKLFNFKGTNWITRLLNKIPWDRQYGPKKLMERLKGDCNSLNYLIGMCFCAFGNYEKIIVVTWWAKPFMLTHTTIFGRKNNQWKSLDYGFDSYYSFFDKLEDSIIDLSKKYKVEEIKCYAIQDIQLNVIKKEDYPT